MSNTTNLGLPLMPDTPAEGVTGLDLRKMINGENEDSMAQILDKIIEPNINKATAATNATMPDDDTKYPTCALVNKVLSNIGGGGSTSQVQSDWDETDTTSPAYIKNKPVITDGGGTSVQANWEQTDETQADFIKNKPFYEYKSVGEEILPLTTFSDFFLQSTIGMYMQQREATYSLTIGETYIVTWDNVDYECIAQDGTQVGGEGSILLGNESAFYIVMTQDNYEVYFALTDTEAGGSHNVRIVQGGTIVKKLDNKYLSFMNCELKDIEILPLTQYDNFSLNTSFGVYTKQDYPIFTLTLGKTYTVTWDGVDYECTTQDASAITSGAVALGNLSPFGLSGNSEPFIIACITGQGVMYASLTDTEFGGVHSVRIRQCGVEIVTVDSEFIEDISWNKISDKPFGKIPSGTVVVDKTTVNCSIEFGTGAYAAIINEPDIVAGVSYEIECDGTTNICIAETTTNNGISGVEVVGNDASCVIIKNYIENTSIIISTQGLHTFKISLAQDIIKTIDPEFIPKIDSLPEVTTSDAGKFLRVGSNGTWIVEAIQDVSEVGL